jgi:hypothetical protein
MKFQKLATVAIIGLLGFTSLAAAEDENPAANANNCADVQGSYSDTGDNKTRVRECVVTVSADEATGVPASHKKQSWTVDTSTPGSVTTYRLAAGEGASTTTSGAGETTVTACYNHQGKSITDFETNPNCQVG